MALNTGDIIQLIDRQLYLGQIVLNIYHYKVDVGNGILSELALLTDWALNKLPIILQVQDQQMVHTELRADNLTDGISFATLAVAQGGALAGAGTPSSIAIGWRFNVTTKVTRPGGKRIGGITEGQTDGNTLIIDPVDKGLLEDTFFDIMDIGVPPGTVVLNNVVVGRDEFGHLDLARTQRVSSGLIASDVTTQASRRANRAP